ncbi:MAG: hypothetical protein BGP01_09155 [Paludibacter sp. 47-17]|nr:MAG: hypothetical protein ABS72_02190 [Paludibacter sp. SCN 50-10]OJX88502.1 MAG: hypothetical protein BGP01_09155 [Paludibacter sp. 47-17]
MGATQPWAVIINLKSGKKHFRQQMLYLFHELKKAGIRYEHKFTDFAGHAVLIARNYARSGFRNFLVVGGDGTISEVVNGIFGAGIETAGIKLAQIPRGTGNDWARFWGLNRDYRHAIAVFLAGNSRPIDIGTIRYALEGEERRHFFINSVGFGLDAAVVRIAHRLKRYIGSHAILYFISLLTAVFRYRPFRFQLKTNGKEIQDVLFTMNIANGCYSGGGMKQNPGALPYDGIFDAMMVCKPSLRDILTALPRLFDGKLLSHRALESFRTEWLELNYHNGGYFEADGILVNCDPPLQIGIEKHALQMIVPYE